MKVWIPKTVSTWYPSELLISNQWKREIRELQLSALTSLWEVVLIIFLYVLWKSQQGYQLAKIRKPKSLWWANSFLESFIWPQKFEQSVSSTEWEFEFKIFIWYYCQTWCFLEWSNILHFETKLIRELLININSILLIIMESSMFSPTITFPY